ncbi:MAG: alpha/beta hydrolase [SAR324 cluster bacterium]|nr:alpha/beta hydrolase [SAR324 cluster bacterium]
MFSEEWNFDQLQQMSADILASLENRKLMQPWQLESFSLPASPDIESRKQVLIIASGYPEHAGVWSYTLLEKSIQAQEWRNKASMESWFERFYQSSTGIIVLNPHHPLKQPPEDSLPVYLAQLTAIYQRLMGLPNIPDIALMGYSLGGDVILRFLQEFPQYIAQTKGLVLVDPSPPQTGRRKMVPELARLMDHATLYGMMNEEGLPGEFAEIAKMRLKLTPELVQCQYHGEVPSVVLNLVCDQLNQLFSA